MLIIPIMINTHCIDYVTAHNIEGDINGVCKYQLNSKHLGDMGIIEHDRVHGVYKLIEKIMIVAHDLDTLDGEDNDW